MDDFDIYSDLPDFAWLKKTYEEDVEINKEELPTSKKDIRELKEKLLKLEKVHKQVLSHYSSLWKTCKQERKRMDRQIAELRSQLDNFAFKRNRQNVAAPPVPVQPPVVFPTQLQASNNQYSYPPPLFGTVPPLMQHVNEHFCNYPPPLVNSVPAATQQWHQPEEKPEEHFVDNQAVPSNVITPENSHSSDESDDDIVKKSEYRSTVYGERLRKKLLEEKRREMRQKQESALNEKKVIQEQSKCQYPNELKNSSTENKVHVLKEKEVTSMKKEIDTKVVKEEPKNTESNESQTQNVKEFSQHEQKLKKEKEIGQLKQQRPNTCENADEVSKSRVSNEKEITSVKKDTNMRIVKEENNGRQNEIKAQITKDSSNREQKLRSEREIAVKDNKKEHELRTTRESDNDRKKREEDLRVRRRDDIETKRKDDDFKSRRERDLERRRREDEPRMRRERDIERRRKEEEMEKIKREEQIEKRRREEETDKRRRDQEVDRRKKEETDKRRRAELDKRRRDEDMERRKRDEHDKKRKEEDDKKRKEKELEVLKEKENDRRRKEAEEKRRKERELEMLKAKEMERKRKEEEQHALTLKEIEKKRNEKQLEELIKERKRIENEMNSLNEQESEGEENLGSIKDRVCKENGAVGKAQVDKGDSKENSNNNPKQSLKNQSDNRRNDDGKAGQRSCENRNNVSEHSNNQTSNDNRRDDCRERTVSKSNQHQDNHTSQDKHKYNDRRSRRDQLDRERERRKSQHRNRSRHRKNSGHRSDEDSSNHSPKRVKLQEKVADSRGRSKNSGADNKSKLKIKSPKRRRQTKSDETSPTTSKRRKISQDKDFDHNIKLDENTAQNTDVTASKKIIEAAKDGTAKEINNCTKHLIDSSISNKNTSTQAVDNRLGLIENTANLKKSVTEDQVKDLKTVQSKLVSIKTDEKSIDHANKKKTLIDELFETHDSPVRASANLKNTAHLDKSLEETILSDLEDGEVEDSDDDLPKSTPQSQSAVKPIETIELLKKNETNKNETATSLLKNSAEVSSKCTSDVKDSILHKILTQSRNDNQCTKFEVREKLSNNKEPVNLEDYTKSETCNEIANKTAGKSSQNIDGQAISVNKTKKTEVKVSKDNDLVGNTSLSQNAGVKQSKTVKLAEPEGKLKPTTEKENQTSDKLNDSAKGEQTDSKTPSKCISNLPETNSLLKQPNQICLKDNTSENKLDNKKRLSKRPEIHNEINGKKDANSKENVDVSNDLDKKNIGQSPITEALNEESSKSVAKMETLSQDNASNSTANVSQRRNVIVVRRRRRPVQLSDSSPVVVINNATVKT